MILLLSNINKGAILHLIEEINDELKNHLSEQKQVVFSSELQEIVNEY